MFIIYFKNCVQLINNNIMMVIVIMMMMIITSVSSRIRQLIAYSGLKIISAASPWSSC
jgi:hypothetical protein